LFAHVLFAHVLFAHVLFAHVLFAHVQINASPDRVLECVLVARDGEAIAVDLDIAPAEKPETVPWVDPIHRDPAATP